MIFWYLDVVYVIHYSVCSCMFYAKFRKVTPKGTFATVLYHETIQVVYCQRILKFILL